MERSRLEKQEIEVVLEDVRRLADALAQALVSSNLREDEKAAWAALIPSMRLDQLAVLAEILARSATDVAAQDAHDLVRRVQGVQERYVAAQAELDHDFASGMSSLVHEVRALERAAGQMSA